MQEANRIEGLFKRHMKTVYKLCYSYFGNAAEAEDATQQVFMKLVDKPRDFNGEAHERAWLIVCAQNLCKDILKSATYTRRADLPENLEEVGGTQAAPEDVLIGEENEMRAAVLALPELYRECIYLYYYEGYSTAEIATLCNVASSTVRNRLADARAALKESLGGEQA